MKKIKDFNFDGKRVLIRVDFNVPLNSNYEVTDATRIIASLPTINTILKNNGRVVLMSHLGRPKGVTDKKYSLKHIVSTLENKLGSKVFFSDSCIGDEAKDISEKLKPGEVLLLENLRFHNEETEGDPVFAQKLAQLGDIYINDAFGTAHRSHASTSIIAKYFEEKGMGLLMEAEIENANRVLKNNNKPFTAIMGGAKISDKLLIVEKLLNKVDNLIIGGGMAYTFFRALGGNVGNSMVEENNLSLALELIKKAKQKGVNLELPKDSKIAKNFSNDSASDIALNFSIPDGWMGLDIGPEASEVFSNVIHKSKTILWNGPMGVFEFENFSAGTKAIAVAVANSTENGAYSLIGGGDSAAAINQLGFGDKVSYVSTGGGALLEFMEGKELPGLKALEG